MYFFLSPPAYILILIRMSTSLQTVDRWFEANSSSVVFWTFAFIYFLYIIVVIGVSNLAPQLLVYLEMFVRIFVCVFLLIRFNPFRKRACTAADNNMVFIAAILLLSAQGLTKLASYFIENTKRLYDYTTLYI